MIFKLLIACILVAVWIDFTTVTANNIPPCADWEQYKDEHCYKLFDGLKSFSDAEKICSANNSTLVSIHYAEEQEFLSNYIFTKRKTVDNVWIGAKYVNSKLQWEDHTPLAGGYSNWATGSPKNRTDYCVQMNGDPDSVGKWVDEPCARKNLAACQRMQLPSIQLLAEAVIELKHTLANTRNEVAQLKKESIPIGFIYVQLPKDKSPTELWPSMTWKDISTDYNSVFFRVVGNDSASFGNIQEYNAPRIEMVHLGHGGDDLKLGTVDTSNNMTIPITGWSKAAITGDYSGNDQRYMNFKQTDIAEVRPKNMAVKVFRRTA